MTSAMNGVYFASRPGGSVAPSRTAAIGGTFVARIAGKMPGDERDDDPDQRARSARSWR